MTDAPPLLLVGAQLPDGAHTDVSIVDGLIAPEPVPGATAIDLTGAVLSPALVDGHIHLDKGFLGTRWRPHRLTASLRERIEHERNELIDVDAAVGVADRAEMMGRRVAEFGTGFLRSHVDVHPEDGLTRLEAVLEARDRLRGIVEIQLVAFPQRGLLSSPGTAELMDAAAQRGADVIGGLDPAGFDGDIEAHLKIVFGIAERHGRRVDIHLHDAGTLGTFQLRRIAAYTSARGLGGRVTVSHAYALGQVSPDELALTLEVLGEAEVSILTNGPGTGGMPPVAQLRDAGVLVFAGSDNIRDAWWPYGTGDMLERAYMIGYRQDLYTDDDLRMAFALATSSAAEAIGYSDGYGVRAGDRANLVAIAAEGVPAAVAAPPARRLVIHDGRVIHNGL